MQWMCEMPMRTAIEVASPVVQLEWSMAPTHADELEHVIVALEKCRVLNLHDLYPVNARAPDGPVQALEVHIPATVSGTVVYGPTRKAKQWYQWMYYGVELTADPNY
jgi:hypothetical protein